MRLALAFVTLIAMTTGKSSRPVISAQPDKASMAFPVVGDEFLGPFPSWTNLKTAYRAAGDGIADDTDAFQRGLNDLEGAQRSPVLFVPAGTYRITRTVTLKFTINVSLVGEDPAKTIIVWDGPDAGTMLHVNGVAYSRIDRLTFDGKRRASIAVDQSYDNSKPHFDTGNEYADDSFVDVEHGIRGGFKDNGFAETSVVRSHFVRNTTAGIALGNFNALDLWVWDSTFDHCGTGVTNTSGAGNFHVYRSIFRNSTTADLSMRHTGGFSARDNYSIGAGAFFLGSYTNHPATIDLQRNIILDPVGPDVVRMSNQGPAVILDNVVRSREGGRDGAIVWSNLFGSDVTSVGNTFTVASAVRSSGRLTALEDRVVPRASVSPPELRLPGTPANLGRAVFEVRPGADAQAIQRVIDLAAGRVGARPVVHIPFGTYSVDRTLIVPAGDLQLTGDGFATILKWTGGGKGPIARLLGPSKSSLREIQFDGASQADGLVVENADQTGGRVYLQQVQLRSGRQTDLLVDGLDETHVQLEDFGHAYSPDATAVVVRGGPLASAGRHTAGRTSIFSGASAGNRVSYDVSGGGRLLVRDVWYESGAGAGFVKVRGRAVFTAQNVRVASPIGAVPAIDVADLNGTVTILTAHLDDRMALAGDGAAAKLLGVGLFCEQRLPECFSDTTAPRARFRIVNSRQKTGTLGNYSISAVDMGAATDAAFMLEMLEHARTERPTSLTPLPASVTDVRLFRIWVANGLNNVMVLGRPTR